MRLLVFGILFALAAGCNEGNTGVSADRTTSNRSTVDTSARVTPGETLTSVESADRANTGINVRDRDGTTKTPLDQNENKADIALTADIRQQVVDTQMSISAQNVKIITQDGKVTLRGPVKTAEEKTRIEEIARAVAGSNNVDSQLEVDNK